MSTSTRRVWWPSAGTVRGGLLGGIATASGMALTATSGWLIVRASEHPVILTLLTAIVAVRAFGMARPVFRYWERLDEPRRRARDCSPSAGRRPTRRSSRSPRPASGGAAGPTCSPVSSTTSPTSSTRRCGSPSRSSRRPSPVASSSPSRWCSPRPSGSSCSGSASSCASSARSPRGSSPVPSPELLAARAEVTRVSELVASQAGELRAVGGWHDGARLARRRPRRRSTGSRGASARAARPRPPLFLVAVGRGRRRHRGHRPGPRRLDPGQGAARAHAGRRLRGHHARSSTPCAPWPGPGAASAASTPCSTSPRPSPTPLRRRRPRRTPTTVGHPARAHGIRQQ